MRSPVHAQPPGNSVIDNDLPLIARLTVYALGAVEGGRIRRPIDPVAAWMVRHRETLAPRGGAPAAFTTIRARTALIDRMLGEELDMARHQGVKLCLWTIGGAFDARWYRLTHLFSDTLVEHREVEAPLVLKLKDRLLADSPYGEQWTRVHQLPKPAEGWTVRPRSGCSPLVILEGLAGRLTPEALKRLLSRIRYETPDARVLLGLPGHAVDEQKHWTYRNIRSLGWKVEEDISLGPRGRLMTPSGGELCPGMYPLRILRLSGQRTGNTAPHGPPRVAIP